MENLKINVDCILIVIPFKKIKKYYITYWFYTSKKRELAGVFLHHTENIPTSNID